MTMQLEVGEMGLTEISGIKIVGLAIGIELQINDAGAFMSGKGDRKSIAIKNSNHITLKEETFTCSNCHNAGLNVNWDDKGISRNCYGDCPPNYDATFSDDVVIVVGTNTGFTPTPSGWPNLVTDNNVGKKFSPSADVNVTESTTDPECPGTSNTYTVEVTNIGIPGTQGGSEKNGNIGGPALRGAELVFEDQISQSGTSTTTKALTSSNATQEGIIRWDDSGTSTFTYSIPEDQPLGLIKAGFLTVDANNGVPPEDAIDQDGPIYDARIFAPVGNDETDFKLGSITDIDNICPGESVSKTITAKSEGKCTDTVKLRISNDAQGEVLSNGPTELAGGESNEFRVRFNAPSEKGTFQYTADLVRKQPKGNTVVSSQTFKIETGGPSFKITSFEAPRKACPGDNIRTSVSVKNVGDCGGPASVDLVNAESGDKIADLSRESIRAGSNRSFRAELTIPSNQTGDFSIQAKALDESGSLAGESVVDTKRSDVSVGGTSISLRNLEFPDEVCVGSSFDWSIEAKNSGKCDSDLTITITPQSTGKRESVATETVRGGSDTTFRATREVPASKIDQGTETYKIEAFVPSDGSLTKVGSTTTTLDFNTSNISVVGTTSPDQKCVGGGITGVITLENSGNCDGEYRVTLSDNISGTSRVVERSEISGNRRERVVFDDTMPTEAVAQGGITYTYTVESLLSTGFVQVNQGTINVPVNTSNVSINEIQAPDVKCVGSSFESTVSLINNSQCEGQYRVILDRPLRPGTEVVEESTIPAGTNKTVSFKGTIPVEAVNNQSVPYEVILETREFEGQQYAKVDNIRKNVSIQKAELAVSSKNVPGKACIGTDVPLELQVSNTGQCETQYRVILDRPVSGESKVISQGTISDGTTVTASSSESLTSDLADDQTASFNFIVEKRQNDNFDWQGVASSSASTQVLKPDVSITSNTYEDVARPGSKKYEIELNNNSECSTSVEVDINGSTTTKQLSPNSSTTVVDEFTLKSDSVNRSVTVLDNRLQKNVDTLDVTVNPHKFINLDQSKGLLEIVGGFSEEAIYSGTVIGTGVRGSNNLEDKDSVVGRVGAFSVQGQASTDSLDKDTIKFTSLKGLSIQVNKTTTVIVDGQIKGQTKTYQHTTVSGSVIGIEAPENPGIKTVSGPLSSLGVIRRRADVGTGVLSGPLVSRQL